MIIAISDDPDMQLSIALQPVISRPQGPTHNSLLSAISTLFSGSEVPEIWRGTLNLTYRFGPGFMKPNTTVRIKVHNIMKETKIYNVIGTIRGREEPDRIVLIGNHRDAWLFGAVDPSSGTSVLVEMSRVIGNLLKTGIHNTIFI